VLANQRGRQRWQPIGLALGLAMVNRHVLALDTAGLIRTLAECGHYVRERVGRCAAEEPDHWQPPLYAKTWKLPDLEQIR
jgi:hypothetical protein